MASEGPAEPVEIRLRELRPGPPVSFIARIVQIERREITRKSDGQRRPILSGLVSDGTGTVRFTWWDPPSEEIDRGTVLRVARAEVREYLGRAELTFTSRTRIAPAAEAELPRLGWEEMPVRAIRDLTPPDEGFRLDARVVRVASRGVAVGAEQRTVFEGRLADGSGIIGFTAWRDFSLREGEAIRIGGGYLRTYRRRPQLVLDDRSIVARLPEGALPPAAELGVPSRPSLARCEAEGGGEVVELAGRVVGLLPPSGLLYRCPECRRRTDRGICPTHGPVAGRPDLAARLVLDDGTGAATVNLDRAATESVSGLTLDASLERLRSTPDPSVIEELLWERLIGTRWTVRGSAYVDDFGLSVHPEAIEPTPWTEATGADQLARRLS
ncbi:MAG: hypothetical protein ACYCPN_03285 [Thermoplasmata archaeon]